MNIHDIVRRADRSLAVLDGQIAPIQRFGAASCRGVAFSAGARLRLARADEFTCLETFPSDLGWTVAATGDAGDPAVFEIRLRDPTTSEAPETLLWRGSAGMAVALRWPLWAGRAAAYDLELANTGPSDIELRCGVAFDPRTILRPLLRGRGFEVGPGLNPIVRPEAAVDVRYVEALPVDDWIRNYAKGREPASADRALFERYVIGDAQHLDCCEDGAADFIFSNHVFEHLTNPVGVLRNWTRKLKAGGAIVGVVPDARYSFDLRQPASSPAEWEREDAAGRYSLDADKYARWCRYTEPAVAPESLVARSYSIHAHYYTPATFCRLVDTAGRRGLVLRRFLNTSPNGRDFGFALWPAGSLGAALGGTDALPDVQQVT